MKRPNKFGSCKGIDIFLDSLKNFLLKNRCDVVCLLLDTYFEKGKCIARGFCFVYFIDGMEKSVSFGEVYEGDAYEIIDNFFVSLNSDMYSLSGTLWDFVVMKVYKSGKVCIEFSYDTPPGSYMRYNFPV